MAATISDVLEAGLHNQLGAHLPRSAFDDFAQIAWNRPQWEYLYCGLANTTNFTFT